MATTVQKAVTIAGVTATIGGIVGVLTLSGTFTYQEEEVPPAPGEDGGPPPTPDAAPPPPPPEEGYQVAITLRPVDGGTNKWISFAVPMPVGVLNTETNIRLRLASGGTEIPIYVKSLGNWRVIPPAEFRCGGYTPGFPGIRSVLVQFRRTVTAGQDLNVILDVGTSGAKLASGTDVLSTFRTVNDKGVLYAGTEGYRQPSTIALIDHKWLSCAGLSIFNGQSDTTPELKKMDDAERNYFYTMIGYYKKVWTSPTQDWPVAAAEAPDLASAENGSWLYQRAQTFFGVYARSGLPDALESFYQSVWHYKTLIFTEQECVGASYPQYCKGFFRLKNPDKNQPYKDTKYSWAEDLSTYYWLTGDEAVLPYFTWIRAAQDTHGAHQYYHTERFHAYALMAPVIQYEITGDAAALAYAEDIVDLLVEKVEGNAQGCWKGNDEWGVDGFSPWMGPFLMQSVARYYANKPTDARVPTMLAKVADCILNHGMAWNSQVENKTFLIPFYGASATGTPRDLDGNNPWVGIEHAINVAQGLALGYQYETVNAKKTVLRSAILNLIKSGEWAFNYWYRTAANRPMYRPSPWRKYNWWFRNAGNLQWLIFEKPTLAGSAPGGGGGGGL